MTLNDQAVYYHECSTSLIKAGFDDDQALALVCAHMHANTIGILHAR